MDWWRRRWHPTPVLLPGKSHGWRSLEGCSPWGRWGSDTTKRLPFHFSLSCIGDGNGNPLRCSSLGNPRDGGAWWAAVYGVTQSRTRLKWLSRWTGMGEFNSDDHYIYYCGQESLRRNGVAITVHKSLKCSTWMQSQKRQNDLCSFSRQTIQYHSNPSLCPDQ